MKFHLWWMNVLKRMSPESHCIKTSTLWKMAEGRFASVCSVEEFTLEHENKNTTQKTERHVILLKRFLKMKHKDRKIEAISAAGLNEYISEFILSVHTKDGKEYKPTSVWSLMTSFERQLKENGYSASIINNLVFEITWKVLQSKQKQLKKQGKGEGGYLRNFWVGLSSRDPGALNLYQS